MFHDANKEITVANGLVFVVSPADHNVLVFNDNGILKKRFGKNGYKEGYLFCPASISVLDNSYLVVADLAFNCKFTLFDLKGNFKCVIKTNKPIYSLVPLFKNRVAYLYQKRIYHPDKDATDLKVSVFIKDIKSGEEIEATSHIVRDPSFLKMGKFKASIYAYYKGDVFIERAKDGSLLVGLSSRPEIGIYSAEDGRKTGTVDLKIKPKAVTQGFIKEFQKEQIRKLSKRKDWPDFKKEFIERISISENFFDEYLPYYRKILTDDQGNIIIILENSSFDDRSIHFQVYSPEGKFLYESTLNLGDYELDVNSLRWFRKLYFTQDYLYALVTPKGDKNKSLRLVKFKIVSK